MAVDEVRRPKPPPPPPPPPKKPEPKAEPKAKAEEAKQKADDASHDVGSARSERDTAKKNLDSAREDASSARSRVKDTEKKLKDAPANHAPHLQKDLERYKGDVTHADAKVESAGKKLQAAEEKVATTSKIAEDRMHEANALATKAGEKQPFSDQQIRETGRQTNEIRDAYDGAGAGRQEALSKKLGVEKTTNTGEIQGQLEGDRQFARLNQDTGSKKEMDRLGIKNGSDLRSFGQRLNRMADGDAPDAGDDSLNTRSPEALSKVIQGAGESLSGAGKARLTNPDFSEQVSQGVDPRDVATHGPELAQRVYDSELKNAVGKPAKDWSAADAAKFNNKLADEMEAHKGDPEFQRSLMSFSSDGLKKSAELIGKYENENGDRGSVESLTRGLTRVGNAAPPDAAARLAWGVSQEMNNDSEQHYVDDGFQKAIDGGASSKFRDMMAGALVQQDKKDSAEELTQKSAGGIDLNPLHALGDVGGAVVDTFKDLAGGVGDAAQSAWDFGGKVLGKAADFAVSAGGKAIDFAGDAAEWSADQVKEGVQKAVEMGLQVTGKLAEAARGLVKEGVTAALNVDGNIKSLKPGDTYSVGGSIDGSLGIKGGIEGDISVKMNDDGSYTVSAGGKLHAGLGAGGEVDVGLGGKAEFTYRGKDALAKATQATESLAVAGAGLGLSGVPAFGQAFGAAMMPKGDDLKNLTGNVSALELDASASAKLDEKLGFGKKGSGAEVSGSADVAYRVEFNKDGSKSLVRNQTLSASADLAGVDLKLPGVGSKLAGVTGEATFTKTTKMALPDSVGDGFKALGALTDPSGLVADATGAQTSISGSLKINGDSLPGGKGAEITFNADHAGTTDVARAGNRLLHGDLKGALNGLDASVSGQWYKDTGFDGGVDAKIAGVGISVTAHNRVTHVGDKFEVNP